INLGLGGTLITIYCTNTFMLMMGARVDYFHKKFLYL
ncbi:unnamed protein product, partial [Rotaria socialis]